MLGALAMLGPFAVDTYLPAFGGMQAALDATPVEMQQTLSAYLLSFGFMFLFHGALSDSFGRKPVIVVSLAVFTVGLRGRGARRPACTRSSSGGCCRASPPARASSWAAP